MNRRLAANEVTCWIIKDSVPIYCRAHNRRRPMLEHFGNILACNNNIIYYYRPIVHFKQSNLGLWHRQVGYIIWYNKSNRILKLNVFCYLLLSYCYIILTISGSNVAIQPWRNIVLSKPLNYFNFTFKIASLAGYTKLAVYMLQWQSKM